MFIEIDSTLVKLDYSTATLSPGNVPELDAIGYGVDNGDKYTVWTDDGVLMACKTGENWPYVYRAEML